jgi:hypothetical protein
MTAQGFPKEILAKPTEARLAYFERDVIIAHPRLAEAHDELVKVIRRPAGASLLFVYGPTGVGKTTLRLGVQKKLMEEVRLELERDPGRIPVAGVEVISPGSGNFNWKDYYARALGALSEPLIEHKLEPNGQEPGRDGHGRQSTRRGTEQALRKALEECLCHRRPLAFFNDEAQHFKKMASGRRLLDQMDAIKSLSSLGGTVQVLIGTYELVDLTNLSAQLSRRSRKIHFSRYRTDSDEDVAAFKSVVLTFQRYLPLAETPDLVREWAYLYEGCLGCVGVLKDWLNRALGEALQGEGKVLTREHLEKCAEPTREWVSMARELEEGEKRLGSESEKGQRDELRAFLMGTHSARTGKDNHQSKAPKPNGRKGHVGQRKPGRDKVGG